MSYTCTRCDWFTSDDSEEPHCQCDEYQEHLEAKVADLAAKLAEAEAEVAKLRAREAHPCIDKPCEKCREYEASTGIRCDRTHAGDRDALAAKLAAAEALATNLRTSVAELTYIIGDRNVQLAAAEAHVERSKRMHAIDVAEIAGNAELEVSRLAAKLAAVTAARDAACDLADEAFQWAYDDPRHPREHEVVALRAVGKEQP